MEIILGLAIGFAAAMAVAVVLLLRRGEGGAFPPGFAEAITELGRGVNDLRVDIQGVRGRVDGIERANDSLRENVTKVQLSLESSGTVTSGLRQTTEAIRQELGKAQEGIARLQEAQRARHELETATAESIRRLEAVIAGTASKGSAGENIVELVFSRLPVEWQVRNFRIGNRTCEFGLRLPNGLVLPIDSKWPATDLVEQLAETDDLAEAARLKRDIVQTVRAKMREVQKYLDPNLTYAYGIAVVPDAVFDVAGEVQAEAHQMNVILVGYSMFVPYLLLVIQTVLASSHDIDVDRLSRTLKDAEDQLRAMSEDIEGRLSRAITMIGNSRDDLRSQLSRVQGGLTQVRVLAETHGEPTGIDEGGTPPTLPPAGDQDGA